MIIGTKGMRVDLDSAVWRKSSRSGPYTDICGDGAFVDDAIAVRDSKNPTGPVLIFTEGDLGTTMYVVQSGKVQLFRMVDDQRRVHGVMEKGDFFHRVYRIEQHLGRTFRHLKPYALYPLYEYFGPSNEALFGDGFGFPRQSIKRHYKNMMLKKIA